MDVRERDDEAGWGDLPGGLGFVDDVRAPAPSRRRRALRTVTWLLVVGALLGGGGVAATRYLGDVDVRGVLASSTSSYSRVLLQLREAADAEALAAVAVTAPRAANGLAADLSRLSERRGARRAAVAAQVAAERDVLLAVAALEQVDRAPLKAWGAAHADLAAAVTAETRTRAALHAVDADAARRLPDTPATLRRISSTVGETVMDDVTRSAGDLLAGLGDAASTADLRAVAGRAAPQRAAVRAAAAGLRGTGDSRVLEAFAGALEAVGELRDITPAQTGAWPGVRDRLEQRLRVVADADDSLEAGAVRGRLPLVLVALDGLVDRAAAAHAAWQPLHDAAVAAQAHDSAALRRYADLVRAQAATWPELQAQVAALAGRQDAPADELAAAVAAVAVPTAEQVAALSALAVPPGTEAAHAALTAGVAGVAAPLRRAGDALHACSDCAVADGAARQALHEAQGALPAWQPALTTWEAAVAAALEAVAARPLPAPPEADAPPPSAP